MHVVHFIWSLERGGAENLLVDLANCQVRHSDVSVLIGNREIDEDVVKGFDVRVRVVRLGRPRHSRNPLHVIRLQREFARLRPDVVHSHDQNLARLWPRLKCPMVVTIHTTEVERSRDLQAYCRVFAISSAVAAVVGAANQRTRPVVVHNGISFCAIATDPPAPPAAQTPFRIVQVARLDAATKGQDLLLEAIARLRCQGLATDLEADFIGDGASRLQLESAADQLGLSPCVRFIGALPRCDVYKTLSRYHLLVQPSRREGFGLTIVEAMAAKVPVLVSDIEGPMEVISQGAHGSWFKRDDADHLAEMILKIREDCNSPGFRARLDVTRAYAQEQFSIEATALRYVEHYRAVVTEHRL